MPLRVDAPRVTLVLAGAGDALPDVLEVDVVRVLGRHLDAARSKRARTPAGPDLELLTVRVAGDAANHEVGEVAKLVGQRVQEPVFAVDDLLGELDGGVVVLFDRDRGTVCFRGTACRPLPEGSAGCGVECFAPHDLDAACRLRQLGDSALGDGRVKFMQELDGHVVFGLFESLLRFSFCNDLAIIGLLLRAAYWLDRTSLGVEEQLLLW